MTLKQLEYFLAIAENGSITKAALSLRISQPPLSLQLKSLEEELGCQLFIRDKKNMVITQSGITLRDQTRQIMALVNETILLLQSGEKNVRMTITIGAITSACNRILPEKFMKLRQSYPNLDIMLHEGSTTKVLSMLESGDVDFGVVREPFNVGAFGSRPIHDSALGENDEDFFMALGQGFFFDDPDASLIDVSSLRDKPIIIHRRYTELFTGVCRKTGFVPNIICQNDNLSSSFSWASSGIGIAILPYTSAIQSTNPELLMKRIDCPTLVSRAYLIWNKSAVLSEEQRAFIHLFDIAE